MSSGYIYIHMVGGQDHDSETPPSLYIDKDPPEGICSNEFQNPSCGLTLYAWVKQHSTDSKTAVNISRPTNMDNMAMIKNIYLDISFIVMLIKHITISSKNKGLFYRKISLEISSPLNLINNIDCLPLLQNCCIK